MLSQPPRICLSRTPLRELAGQSRRSVHQFAFYDPVSNERRFVRRVIVIAGLNERRLLVTSDRV